VRPGDTLFSIAVRFRVSVFALAFANGIKNPNLIFAGMVLRVPCENVPPPPPSNICSYYTVQRGDWLLLIAARFVWSLIA
jgi:putative chitinase